MTEPDPYSQAIMCLRLLTNAPLPFVKDAVDTALSTLYGQASRLNNDWLETADPHHRCMCQEPTWAGQHSVWNHVTYAIHTHWTNNE